MKKAHNFLPQLAILNDTAVPQPVNYAKMAKMPKIRTRDKAKNSQRA